MNEFIILFNACKDDDLGNYGSKESEGILSFFDVKDNVLYKTETMKGFQWNCFLMLLPGKSFTFKPRKDKMELEIEPDEPFHHVILVYNHS
jgi:hypothetical protein